MSCGCMVYNGPPIFFMLHTCEYCGMTGTEEVINAEGYIHHGRSKRCHSLKECKRRVRKENRKNWNKK